MRFKLIFCFLISWLCIATVHAEDGCWSSTGVMPQAQAFVVSGVLQKRSDQTVIKLIQSVETNNSQDKALLSFAEKVRKQYPEYTVLDALIASVAKDTSIVCNSRTKDISV